MGDMNLPVFAAVEGRARSTTATPTFQQQEPLREVRSCPCIVVTAKYAEDCQASISGCWGLVISA